MCGSNVVHLVHDCRVREHGVALVCIPSRRTTLRTDRAASAEARFCGRGVIEYTELIIGVY